MRRFERFGTICTIFLELAPRKLELWFVLWGFFLLRLLCISINLPYAHVWNTVVTSGGPTCYLELLDKLQKRICRNIGPSLAASLKLLTHRRNVACLTLFYRYYFSRCSSKLAELVPFPFSRGRSTRSFVHQ